MMNNWRATVLIGSAAALLTGCENPTGSGPEGVDYGKAIPVTDVQMAIENLYHDSDPLSTKVGAYAHFETSDNVAAGTLSIVVADTAQTIVNRNEDASTVTYDLVEQKVVYHQTDNSSQSVTRGYQLAFKKDVVTPPASAATVATPLASRTSVPEALTLNWGWLLSLGAGNSVGGLLSVATATAHPAGNAQTPAPTFHKLKVWEDKVAAPAAVQARPNCLGLAGCQITMRHLTFDIVSWDDPQGSPTHLELAVSPDVPQSLGYEMSGLQTYLPGLMKSCLTQLVTVDNGNSASKTLITECQQVDDFLFASAGH